jgi:hypothetical protein
MENVVQMPVAGGQQQKKETVLWVSVLSDGNIYAFGKTMGKNFFVGHWNTGVDYSEAVVEYLPDISHRAKFALTSVSTDQQTQVVSYYPLDTIWGAKMYLDEKDIEKYKNILMTWFPFLLPAYFRRKNQTETKLAQTYQATGAYTPNMGMQTMQTMPTAPTQPVAQPATTQPATTQPATTQPTTTQPTTSENGVAPITQW